MHRRVLGRTARALSARLEARLAPLLHAQTQLRRLRQGLRLGSMALPTDLDAMVTAPHGTTTLEVVSGSAKASEATCASHPPLSSRYSKPCVRRGYKEFPAPVLKMEDGLCAG